MNWGCQQLHRRRDIIRTSFMTASILDGRSGDGFLTRHWLLNLALQYGGVYDGVFGRFDLAALCGCHTLKFVKRDHCTALWAVQLPSMTPTGFVSVVC